MENVPNLIKLPANFQGCALLVVKERPLFCLKCRKTGHIRKNCNVVKCILCKSLHQKDKKCKEVSYAMITKDKNNRDLEWEEFLSNTDGAADTEDKNKFSVADKQISRILDKSAKDNKELDHRSINSLEIFSQNKAGISTENTQFLFQEDNINENTQDVNGQKNFQVLSLKRNLVSESESDIGSNEEEVVSIHSEGDFDIDIKENEIVDNRDPFLDYGGDTKGVKTYGRRELRNVTEGKLRLDCDNNFNEKFLEREKKKEKQGNKQRKFSTKQVKKKEEI